MKKVLIPTKLDVVARDLLQAKGFQVVQDAEADLQTLLAAHSDAEALIVRSEPITAQVIDALPKLKTVVRAGAGYNTIDIKYARRQFQWRGRGSHCHGFGGIPTSDPCRPRHQKWRMGKEKIHGPGIDRQNAWHCRPGKYRPAGSQETGRI